MVKLFENFQHKFFALVVCILSLISIKMSKKSAHLKLAQKKKLIEIMAEKPHLRCGKFSQFFTKKHAQEEWTQIAEILNSIPGTKKDWKMWRKTWQDLMSKTKNKQAQINRERRQTGGGPPPEPLDDTEEQMAALINPNSIEGHKGVEESLVVFQILDENEDFSPSAATPVVVYEGTDNSEAGEIVNSRPAIVESDTPSNVQLQHDSAAAGGTEGNSRSATFEFDTPSNVQLQHVSSEAGGTERNSRPTTASSRTTMKSLLKEKIQIKKAAADAKIDFYKQMLEVEKERNVILREWYLASNNK